MSVRIGGGKRDLVEPRYSQDERLDQVDAIQIEGACGSLNFGAPARRPAQSAAKVQMRREITGVVFGDVLLRLSGFVDVLKRRR